MQSYTRPRNYRHLTGFVFFQEHEDHTSRVTATAEGVKRNQYLMSGWTDEEVRDEVEVVFGTDLPDDLPRFHMIILYTHLGEYADQAELEHQLIVDATDHLDAVGKG